MGSLRGEVKITLDEKEQKSKLVETIIYTFYKLYDFQEI